MSNNNNATEVKNMSNKLHKVNFFDANRDMSDRVSEFMFCVIHKKDIMLTYSKKIVELDKLIENTKKVITEGSTIPGLVDKAKDMIPGLEAQITEVRAQRDALIESEAKFVYEDFDKNFRKSLNAATEDSIPEIIATWYDNFGLDVRGSYLVDELCGKFGYKINFGVIVASEGKTTTKIDAGQALKLMYAISYEHMIQAGTIKPTQIPELVREKYGKKAKKKAKKEAQKES